ncbi:hypothetical protein RMATCC62417_11753 [Rhizopus microsporus]|nr:hypothetical protein RMATCC62417_11753 [Rhizopus microsporus]
METNNYIESWHNQLKTDYLQRKRNRRLDRLIFILVDDVHADFMHNTARMAANTGRMSSKTREVRKRVIAAEEINELSLEDMVQRVYTDEEACYIVKSFATDISTEQGMMAACNCIDFQRNRRACKHMYLVYPFDKSCVVYSQEIDSSLRVHTMDETTLIQNTVESNDIEAVIESSDVLQSEVPSQAGSRTDRLLTSITSVCRQALESRIHLTSENNSKLSQI